ncbi:MAG: ATP:cob(I)alamin adenosyltransferase [Acholeplasmataceae bacterium]|jgi:cob(I)alamin adenosyltransferase|nr:ATP:cob(I)alamin adenosyltransferase [Acholeplasmataceae bacterium]
MSIFTKRGDEGSTDLIGKRVKKSDLKIHIVGELDELSVRMADFLVACKDETLKEEVRIIDGVLYKIAAIVTDVNKKFNLEVSDEDILFLEERINEMEEKTPVLREFITYEGELSAIKAFGLKTQTRALERLLVEDKLPEKVYKYINRLSDYYFVLGRYINFKANFEERKRKL